MLYLLVSDLCGARPETRSAGLHDCRRIYKDVIKLGSSTFNNNPDDPEKNDDPEKDDPEKKDDPDYTPLPAATGESDTSAIPEFWLTALRNHPALSEMITDRDADALKSASHTANVIALAMETRRRWASRDARGASRRWAAVDAIRARRMAATSRSKGDGGGGSW